MLVSLSMGDVGSSGIGVLQLKAKWRVATTRGNGSRIIRAAGEK